MFISVCRIGTLATEATSSVMAGADGGEAVITSLGTAGDVTLTGSVELSVVLTSWPTLFSTGASGCSGVLCKPYLLVRPRITESRGGEGREKNRKVRNKSKSQHATRTKKKKKIVKIDSVANRNFFQRIIEKINVE